MAPVAEVIVDIRQDFYHASAIYAGMDSLSRSGAIKLRFHKADSSLQSLVADSLTVCLRIRNSKQAEPHILAIDLHDQCDVFSHESLGQCDAYYKRSFRRDTLSALPTGLANKIRPFGLNYACRTWGSTTRLLKSMFPILAQGVKGFNRVRHFLALPNVADFEQSAAERLEPTIVFQTRVWEPHDTAEGECEAINDTRVSIVRALRKAFGDRFRGGLIPTKLALSRYPDDISLLPSRRRLYTRESKRNLIGIYTKGLYKSNAFKLAEYIAASQCIVAEKLHGELPTPLLEGINILSFTDPDSCVEACRELLANPELIELMRRSNHEYYKNNVLPSAHLGQILAQHVDILL